MRTSYGTNVSSEVMGMIAACDAPASAAWDRDVAPALTFEISTMQLYIGPVGLSTMRVYVETIATDTALVAAWIPTLEHWELFMPMAKMPSHTLFNRIAAWKPGDPK